LPSATEGSASTARIEATASRQSHVGVQEAEHIAARRGRLGQLDRAVLGAPIGDDHLVRPAAKALPTASAIVCSSASAGITTETRRLADETWFGVMPTSVAAQ
jgi:hypothetical protein